MKELWVVTRQHTHKGAYDGEDITLQSIMSDKLPVILTPEPCNIDQAVEIRYVQPHAREALPPFCKRCFKPAVGD